MEFSICFVVVFFFWKLPLTTSRSSIGPTFPPTATAVMILICEFSPGLGGNIVIFKPVAHCFSVAKATLESQMSVCDRNPSASQNCSYRHRAYQPLSLSTIEPIDHQAYRPSSLSTIKRINQQANHPSSLLTIEPIDHWAFQLVSNTSDIKQY